MKSKQDFILDTLRGYFQDPSTCAIDNDHCKYRTEDGRKCAFGQHIRDDAYYEQMEGQSAKSLLEDGVKSFLTEEAQAQNLTITEWQLTQQVHDCLAGGENNRYMLGKITNLEEQAGIDLTELKQLYETHTH